MEAARCLHKWQPRRCANIAGALNPRPNARSALDLRSAKQTYQPNLRENSRAARATGKICLFERRDAMTNEIKSSAEDWKYAQRAMSWYGWGLLRRYWPIHRCDRHFCRAAACRGGDPMTAHPNRSTIGNAVRAPLHVVIIGGGIGGLTLAQGLKKSGVSVAVYERDRTR